MLDIVFGLCQILMHQQNLQYRYERKKSKNYIKRNELIVKFVNFCLDDYSIFRIINFFFCDSRPVIKTFKIIEVFFLKYNKDPGCSIQLFGFI